MPARKTIAAERRDAMTRRKNLMALVIGGIPIVILAIVAGVFLYQRATSLGEDELPSSLGAAERQEIQKAVEGFYGYVNQYNPEFISSTMLPVPELGLEEFSRLVMSVAPLESEQLTFRVLNLGTTTLDPERKIVSARVATNFGTRDFELTRRDGAWKIAAVPDLLVPQDAGQVRVEWSVTHSFVIDPADAPPQAPDVQPAAAPQPAAAGQGTAPASPTQPAPTAQATPPPQKTLFVVGRVKNTGNQSGYMLSASSFVTDGAGKTLATARPPMPGNPYLDPGEEGFFQVQFTVPPGATLDPANFVMVPDFRPVATGIEAQFVAAQVPASPSSVTWRPQTDISTTVTNGEAVPVTVQVFAYFRDASGRVLFVTPISPDLALPPGSSVPVPLSFREMPAALSSVVTIDFSVFATLPRPQGS